MGLMKRHFEWATASGRDLGAVEGIWVCAACLSDAGLGSFVAARLTAEGCTFCNQRVGARLDLVVEFMDERLSSYYGDPAEWLPYETREGGYQGTVYDTSEVVDDVLSVEGRLREAIIDGLGIDRLWCDADPFAATESEAMVWSWDRFCEVIMHERRFFFMDLPEQDAWEQCMNPRDFLGSLGALVSTHNLTRTLPAGAEVFRVRERTADLEDVGPAFGPPPREHAIQTNRMSPAGVPMLYVAMDEQTALREVGRDEGTYAVGRLRLRRAASVLDLTQLPAVPSVFQASSDSVREQLLFLRHFVRQVSKPIARDDRVHLNYLPTQVVSEFFRHYVKHDGNSLDGLTFPSSVRTGGTNLALFVDPQSVLGSESQFGREGDPWIELVGVDDVDLGKT